MSEQPLRTANEDMDPNLMSGQARREFGVTISFEADNGHRLTLHHTGSVIKAIRSACAVALARDESYRVVAVSTPSTIFSDLQGRSSTDSLNRQHFVLPETTLLSRAGLLPLLHPRLAFRKQWPS